MPCALSVVPVGRRTRGETPAFPVEDGEVVAIRNALEEALLAIQPDGASIHLSPGDENVRFPTGRQMQFVLQL